MDIGKFICYNRLNVCSWQYSGKLQKFIYFSVIYFFCLHNFYICYWGFQGYVLWFFTYDIFLKCSGLAGVVWYCHQRLHVLHLSYSILLFMNMVISVHYLTLLLYWIATGHIDAYLCNITLSQMTGNCVLHNVILSQIIVICIVYEILLSHITAICIIHNITLLHIMVICNFLMLYCQRLQWYVSFILYCTVIDHSDLFTLYM